MSDNNEIKTNNLNEQNEKVEVLDVRIISADSYLKGDGVFRETIGKIESEIKKGDTIIPIEPLEFPMYIDGKRNDCAFRALKLAKKIKLREKDNFVKEDSAEMAKLTELISKAQKGEKYEKTITDKLVSFGQLATGAVAVGLIAAGIANADKIKAGLVNAFNKSDDDLKNQTTIEEAVSSNDGVTISQNEKGEYVVSAPSLNDISANYPSFEEAVPSEYDENAFEDANVNGNFVTDISYEDFIEATDAINKKYDEAGYDFSDEDVRAVYLLFNKDKISQEDLTYLETTEVPNTGETYINPTPDGKLRDVRDFISNYTTRVQNATAGTYSIDDTLPDLTDFITSADTMKVYNKNMEAINVLADKNTDKELAMKYYEAIQAWSMGLPSDLLGNPNSLNSGERYFFNQVEGRGILNGAIVGGKLGNQKEADKLYDAIMGTYTDENGITQGNTEIRRTEDVKAYLEGTCKARTK